MMTKRQIQVQISQSFAGFRTMIERAPLPSFFLGIAVGALLVMLRSYIYPVCVFAIIILAGFWLFAEDDRDGKRDGSTSDRPTPDQAS